MSRFFQQIRTKDQLMRILGQIHFDCYTLVHKAFGKKYQNAGNIGIFAHSESEYQFLQQLRAELVKPSANPAQKYFELKEPITMPQTSFVPATTYRYLYIRKPDPSPYGQHSGDVDFFVSDEEYTRLTQQVRDKKIKGASIYHYPPDDMIEIADESVSALAYVSLERTTRQVHIAQTQSSNTL